MPITVTVPTSPDQDAEILHQVNTLRAGDEPNLTVDEFVSRQLLKQVDGWIMERRSRVLTDNQQVLASTIAQLIVDPARDEKLASIGLRVTPTGKLAFADPIEPVTEPIGSE
jgi:hypothetical protein